jgi:large subunit ribosomal protein L40e
MVSGTMMSDGRGSVTRGVSWRTTMVRAAGERFTGLGCSGKGGGGNEESRGLTRSNARLRFRGVPGLTMGVGKHVGLVTTTTTVGSFLASTCAGMSTIDVNVGVRGRFGGLATTLEMAVVESPRTSVQEQEQAPPILSYFRSQNKVRCRVSLSEQNALILQCVSMFRLFFFSSLELSTCGFQPESTTHLMPAQIFVKGLDGKTLTLDVELTDSVESIKRQVEEREGIPIIEQRLIFSGKQLDNDRELSDYNVQRDCTLHLTMSLLGGGNKSSSSINQTISVCSESVVNAMKQTNNSASGSVMTVQNLTFELGAGAYMNCGTGGFNASQTSTATLNVTANFMTENSSQIATMITTALDTAAASSNKQVSGFLNTSFGNSSSSNTTINESIKTLVTSNITDITNNSCMASVTSIQNGKYTFNGTLISPGGCSFGQDLQVALAVACMSNTISSLVSQNTELTDVVSKAAATNDQTATGPIEEVFAGIASVFSSLTLPIIIGIIAIVGIVIVFVLFKMFTGGGDSGNSRGLRRRKEE